MMIFNTSYQVQLHIVCTSLALLAGVGASCTYKGQEVCEGAVVKEMKKSVRICTEGKVLKKKKEEVEPGYPLAGGECKWYGEVLCDGAVVQVGVNASTILSIILLLQGSVPMVVPPEMLQVQDVCGEQVLAGREF